MNILFNFLSEHIIQLPKEEEFKLNHQTQSLHLKFSDDMVVTDEVDLITVSENYIHTLPLTDDK